MSVHAMALCVEQDALRSVFHADTDVFGRKPFQSEVGIPDVSGDGSPALLHAGEIGIHAPVVRERVAPSQLHQRRPGVGTLFHARERFLIVDPRLATEYATRAVIAAAET